METHVRTADHPLELNWIEYFWVGITRVERWNPGAKADKEMSAPCKEHLERGAPWQWKSMHKMCTQNICRAFNHFPLILTSGPHNSWQKYAPAVNMSLSVEAYSCRAHACGHSTSKVVDTVVDTTSVHSQSTLEHTPSTENVSWAGAFARHTRPLSLASFLGQQSPVHPSPL